MDVALIVAAVAAGIATCAAIATAVTRRELRRLPDGASTPSLASLIAELTQLLHRLGLERERGPSHADLPETVWRAAQTRPPPLGAQMLDQVHGVYARVARLNAQRRHLLDVRAAEGDASPEERALQAESARAAEAIRDVLPSLVAIRDAPPRWRTQARGLRGWAEPALHGLSSARRRVLTWETIGVVALTGIAGALRTYRLSELPFGLRFDEGYVGVATGYIRQLGWIGPYMHENAGYPLLPVYFYERVIRALGPSVFSLRLGAALLGTATIPIAYVAFRQIASARVAFCSALLLAVSHWHMALSRLAYPAVGWPLMEVLSFGFLALGIRTRRWYYYLAAGATAMLCWYMYQAGLLFVFGLGVFFVVRIATASDIRRLREVLLWGILAGGALLTAMPMIHYFREPGHPSYGAHSDLVSITNTLAYKQADTLPEKARFWFDREVDYYRQLGWESTPGLADGIGVKPPLDWLTGALIAAGIVIAARRWRQPLYLLAILMVPVMSLGSVLTVGEVYRRSFGIVPFLALLGGLTLGVLWERTDTLPLLRRAPALAGLAVLTAMIAYSNIHLHFVTYAHSPANRTIFDPEITFAADQVQKLPDDTYMYFYSDVAPRYQPIMRFLLGPKIEARSEERSRTFGKYSFRADQCEKCRAPYPVTSGFAFHQLPLVYVFVDAYVTDLPRVMARYPEGEVGGRDDKYGPLYRTYYLPHGAPSDADGVFVPTASVAMTDAGAFTDGVTLPAKASCTSTTAGALSFLYYRYTPASDSYAVFAKQNSSTNGDVMVIWRLGADLKEANCVASGQYAPPARVNDPPELGLEAIGGSVYYVGVAVDPAAGTPAPDVGMWEAERSSP